MFVVKHAHFCGLNINLKNKIFPFSFYVQYTNADVCLSTKRKLIIYFIDSRTHKKIHINVLDIFLFNILVLINSFILESKDKESRNIK